MEGTVRFLLLTLLATAATALYEYDRYFVLTSLENLVERTTVGYQLHNTDAQVQWEIDVTERREGSILFKADPDLYKGQYCNEKPALTLHGGPMAGRMFCLAQMNFMTTTFGTNQQLSVVLSFVESGRPDNLIPVFFDLWKKPSIEVQLYPGVVEAEPISELEAIAVNFAKSFLGSAQWLDIMFGRGICELPLLPDEPIGTQPMLRLSL